MENSIDIPRLAVNIIAYLLVPLGSAFIGTWWGSRKLISYKEEEKKRIRGIAIKALNILKNMQKIKILLKWQRMILIHLSLLLRNVLSS